MTISADTRNRAGYGLALTSAGNELCDAVDASTTALSSQSIDGTLVKNLPPGTVTPGIPLVLRYDLAAGALADTDIIVPFKVRVIDAHLVLAGAGVATTTLQVKNGATAITDAMAASGAVKSLVRAAQIDTTQCEVAANSPLRVSSATGASQPAAVVYVTVVRVP